LDACTLIISYLENQENECLPLETGFHVYSTGHP
jgi:hypothetical protein